MPGVVPLVLLGCAVALGLLGGLAALARRGAQASGGAHPPASRRLLVLLLCGRHAGRAAALLARGQ